MRNNSMHSRGWGRSTIKTVLNLPKYLVTWLLMDAVYLCVIMTFLGDGIDIPTWEFFTAHFSGITIGTLVMFTGLGAGVLWIPILTFLHVKPSEAVSISIFTQIAGKGMGSINYLLAGMVDLKVARYFIPFALMGALTGYIAGFILSMKYEKILLVIFLVVASYLLVTMIQSLNDDPDDHPKPVDTQALVKSAPIVLISSFFTGLLSIGNTDWLIPHMEQKLQMNTSRSVATGLFVMFITSLFFLLMTQISVCFHLRSWPHSTPLLFATCSGVMIGGQIGTRLIRYPWLLKRQKHAFILLLALSIIHLLW